MDLILSTLEIKKWILNISGCILSTKMTPTHHCYKICETLELFNIVSFL